ncbi:MAG: hypothetical protein IJJ99_03145 [Oscillospiraceae bacterium]|nr:hypothetical protein [Oscillospiraceae bacterium]
MERIKRSINYWIQPSKSAASIARRAYLFRTPIRKIEEKSICMKARIEKDASSKQRK